MGPLHPAAARDRGQEGGSGAVPLRQPRACGGALPGRQAQRAVGGPGGRGELRRRTAGGKLGRDTIRRAEDPLSGSQVTEKGTVAGGLAFGVIT